MSFVKLDCGLLDSTLWIDRVARELFITALLMAEPHELKISMKQFNARDLNETGFVVPEGWYGFVPAAGTGIIHRAGVSQEEGLKALERLGSEDPESRSPEFGGRRLIRIDGGYIVLNFVKYRDKDSTTAERSRRWRERQKLKALTSRVTATPSPVIRHQAEAEAEAEAEVKEKNICPFEIKFMETIGALYKRRPSTVWDGNEMKKMREILKRPEWESELSEIQKLYGSGYKYARQNIVTLLNQWNGELDRARGNYVNPVSNRKQIY